MKYENGNFIGVFDSGIGGISVLNECISNMPNENYVYFADSDNYPYGKKTKPELKKIGIDILSNFNSHGAKEVIISCNTMSTCDEKLFGAEFKDLHIVGTFPSLAQIFRPNLIIKEQSLTYDKNNGLKKEVKKIKLLIIATTATCKSKFLKDEIDKYNKLINIYVEPADFIVNAVQNDNLNSFAFKNELEYFLKEYKDVDYMLLGCTHFPFAKKQISEILGDKVKFISGNTIAANNAQEYLKNNNASTYNQSPYIVIIDSQLNEKKEVLYRKLINSDNHKLNFELSF